MSGVVLAYRYAHLAVFVLVSLGTSACCEPSVSTPNQHFKTPPGSVTSQLTTPANVARSVATRLLEDGHTFVNWEGGFSYGGAVTAMGVADAAGLVDNATAEALISSLDVWLDEYLKAPDVAKEGIACGSRQPYGPSNKTRSCAWALLNSPTTLPADEYGTVGDQLGLFPIAYLERFLERGGSNLDAAVATTAVLEFVRKYPHRIPDQAKTISRTGGCCGPAPKGNSAPYLWADDQFMGLALMSRLSAAAASPIPSARKDRANEEEESPLPTPAVAKALIDTAVTMQLQYSKYLRSSQGTGADGLSTHGAWVGDDGTLKRSCCKWGRANGWGAMSRAEVLTAMDLSFPKHPMRQNLISDFVDFIDALVAVQDQDDGRWHQLMDMPSTYLETSATAMVVTALAKGVTHGWFSAHRIDEYVTSVKLGWGGLLKTVNIFDGTVTGVCQGTGIMPNSSDYAARPHKFADSAPGGVGFVLIAAAAVAEMERVLDGIERPWP